MGASAGGVEALRAWSAGLPPDLPAAVVVVLHIPRGAPSALPGILDRAGPLPAVAAEQAAALRAGVVHVAPADHHVLVVDGHLRLSPGPIENGHRPAIDPLFRSAALAPRPGRDRGGALRHPRRRHGRAGGDRGPRRRGRGAGARGRALRAMPANALAQVPGALVHPPRRSGRSSPSWRTVRRSRRPPSPSDGLLLAETRIATSGVPGTRHPGRRRPRRRSAARAAAECSSSCPGMPVPRFRCRVGHAWSPESLVDEQAQAVDEALWVALRALEEKADADRAARRGRAPPRGTRGPAEAFAQRAACARAQAQQVRDLVEAVGARTRVRRAGSAAGG